MGELLFKDCRAFYSQINCSSVLCRHKPPKSKLGIQVKPVASVISSAWVATTALPCCFTGRYSAGGGGEISLHQYHLEFVAWPRSANPRNYDLWNKDAGSCLHPAEKKRSPWLKEPVPVHENHAFSISLGDGCLMALWMFDKKQAITFILLRKEFKLNLAELVLSQRDRFFKASLFEVQLVWSYFSSTASVSSSLQ